MVPASKLANGATVMAIVVGPEYGTVLAYSTSTGKCLNSGDIEFITWEFRADAGHTYNGHYHEADISGASREFLERAAKVLEV